MSGAAGCTAAGKTTSSTMWHCCSVTFLPVKIKLLAFISSCTEKQSQVCCVFNNSGCKVSGHSFELGEGFSVLIEMSHLQFSLELKQTAHETLSEGPGCSQCKAGVLDSASLQPGCLSPFALHRMEPLPSAFAAWLQGADCAVLGVLCP